MKKLLSLFSNVLSARSNAAAALQSLLTKFFVLGLNASTSILIARMLRPEGRGEMTAIMMWSGFLGSLLTLGIPSSLIYNLKRDPQSARAFTGSSFVLSSVVSLAIAVIGWASLPFWLHQYPHSLLLCAQWFLLSSPIPIFLLVGRAALEGQGKFLQSNLSWWTGPVLTLLGLITLAALHRLTPVTGALAYVLGNLPVVLWLCYQVWSTYRPTWLAPLSCYGRLLHYGLRSWGIDLLNALSLQADQVLVVRFLAPEAMGIYVVSTSLARLLSAFQTSAVMVLLPRVAARSASEVLDVTGQTLRMATGGAVVGSLLVGAVGPFLLSLLYGPQYAAQGTMVFRILLLEVVLSGATQILAQAFMALGRPGIVTSVQAIGVASSLVLMQILIPTYGVNGAGLSLAISSIIRFSLTMICFRVVLRQRVPNPIPTPGDFATVLGRIRSFALRPAAEGSC